MTYLPKTPHMTLSLWGSGLVVNLLDTDAISSSMFKLDLSCLKLSLTAITFGLVKNVLFLCGYL